MIFKRSLLIAAAMVLASGQVWAQTDAEDDHTGSRESPPGAHSEDDKYRKHDVAELNGEIARLRKSARPIDMFELGSLLQQGYGPDGVDLKGAYDFYEKAADGEIVPAQELMCIAYLLGDNRPADFAKAMSYCTKLKPTSPVVTFAGAYDYDKGLTGPKDPDAAMSFYLEAAQGGNAEAMDALGQKLLARPDKAELARAWFRQAAMQGSASGMDHLADMVAAGQGGPADTTEADWLYVNAARRGNAHARSVLVARPQPPARLSRSRLTTGKKGLLTETITDKNGTHTRPFSIENFAPNEDALFPKGTLDTNVEGMATVHCYINDGHRLDICLLQREYPVGLNFGTVLKAMVNLNALSAADTDCDDKPTARTVFALTMRWKMDGR